MSVKHVIGEKTGDWMSKVGVVAALAVWVAIPSTALAQDGPARGYEQVSPADKGGALLAVGTNLSQAGAARSRPALAVASDGDGVSYPTLGNMFPAPAGGPPTAPGVAQLYAFRRGPSGWAVPPTPPPPAIRVDSPP